MSLAESVWYGTGAAPSLARAALTPASWLYGAGARLDGWFRARGQVPAALPSLSVGNLSVGGTGKTPVAAWAAAELLRRGASPAIVMRGYGGDEPLVHARLNPAVRVITDADRVRGVERARELGADCVILDDAFQHRRIARLADWVLVAAEQWRQHQHVLPAGPLREPRGALARADVIIVTRKSASAETAERVVAAMEAWVPREHVVRCRLALGSLRSLGGDAETPLSQVRGQRVLAIAAVGEPGAFFAQLREAGAHVDEAAYPDHHAFDASDVARLAQRSASADLVVCTLKDAVKLGPRWTPAALPVWYVSQHLVIEHGQDVLDHWIETVLAARLAVSSTAGSAGPSNSPHGHRSSTAD